jgi:hypothetical protein
MARWACRCRAGNGCVGHRCAVAAILGHHLGTSRQSLAHLISDLNAVSGEADLDMAGCWQLDILLRYLSSAGADLQSCPPLPAEVRDVMCP